MNCIFLDVMMLQDKFKILHRAIDENKNLEELCINEENIKNILNLIKNGKIFSKFKIRNYERKLIKYINSLKKENEKNYYIFSNNIEQRYNIKEYLQQILKKTNIDEYTYRGEYKKNINKHIEIYSKNINKEELNIKCMIILENLYNLDIDMIQSLAFNHKIINIYSLEKPDRKVINKINEFNKREGTTIDIMKNTVKAYKDYDVAIYIDKPKVYFKKLRFNTNTLHLDLTNKDDDVLDTSYIKVNKLIEESKLMETVINRLYKNYGRINTASIISKII